MDTVEFTCGHCGQTLAVAPENLGQPVECPHCQQVIQPAAGAVNSPPAESAPDAADAPVPAIPPPEPPAAADATTTPPAPPTPELPTSPPVPTADVPAALGPHLRPRRQVVPVLLIFLIPYALVTTGAVAWLLWKQQRNDQHPLEWLLDSQPGDGGPKRVKHDVPLSSKLKTPLGKALRIGAVEVLPTGVEMNPAGDRILLTLKVRNVSDDLRFNPLPQSFLSPEPGSYTFLEFGKHRIYGGQLAWLTGPPGQERPCDGMLLPGDEMTVTLQTTPRDKATVQQVVGYRGPMLWRLEVRRGLVVVRQQDVSATAVVGVEFDATALLQDVREVARAR